MTKHIQPPSRLLFTAALIGSLSLSACATKSNQKAQPSDRQSQEKGQRKNQGKGQAPKRSSGTFVKPIGLLFSGMDSNNDAIVTKSELAAGIQTEWSGFERNPSLIDFSFWSIAKLGSTDSYPTFMMFDKNFNSLVSGEEFSERLDTEFTKLDINKDGQLERSEMLVAFAAPEGEEKPKGGKSDKGGKGGKGGGPPQR